MGLVEYSDSETSDIEHTPVPDLPSKQQPAKPTFQKVTNPSEPRKIKVDLPALAPETQNDEPPAKKVRTAGAFSGFNSFLPAPKRAPTQNAPKAGVSLRTSSEAAFSRAPVQQIVERDDNEERDRDEPGVREEKVEAKVEEPKMVGKATRFKPLSVANNKKKKPIATAPISETNGEHTSIPKAKATEMSPKAPDVLAPKARRSLFSVPQEESIPDLVSSGTYEPLTNDETSQSQAPDPTESHTSYLPSTAAALSQADSLTADMNLTAAQKRQLFGRHAKTGDINIAHFNMENEYAANEQLRQAGDVVEHRAVKAIAPGKHSLQQLVNNARSQQEAIEDKWAEGRRNRGEGSAKYGWGK